MQIVSLEHDRGATCEGLLRRLPEWFGIEQSIVEYARDVEAMDCLAALRDDRVVGFVALRTHNEFNMEIHVMAVDPSCHGQGIGTALVARARALATARGHRFMTVKTLSPSRNNEPYARTRRFYRSVDFVPLEEFPTLWGEANPCLLMINTLD